MVDREQVTEERSNTGVGRRLGQKEESEQHGDEALQRVAGEGEHRRDLASGAQHVGRSRVLRAVAARVG
jgi:hypothetical protein